MAAESPEKSSTSQVLDDLDFQVYDQSGINWTYEQNSKLSQELRTFASKYLNPLPEYNCLARDFSTAFNDKLIVIARSTATGEIVAFASTVYLFSFNDKNIPFVLHTGLTCIAENLRRNSMTIFLFFHIFKHLVFKYPEGYWLSNLAGVISSLGSITRYGINVYPSPSSREPSATHRLIASVIDLHHRDKMLISPDAIFDSERFVFRKSNGPDSCFRKHRDDVRYSDRHNTVNDYYRGLLGEDDGDEVLQVAFMDQRILILMKESRLEKLNDRWSKL